MSAVRKWTDVQIREIRQRYADGDSQTNIAKAYGMQSQYVSAICSGRVRKNAGGPIIPTDEGLKGFRRNDNVQPSVTVQAKEVFVH